MSLAVTSDASSTRVQTHRRGAFERAPEPQRPGSGDARHARRDRPAPIRDAATGPRELGQTAPPDPVTRPLSEIASRTRGGRRWDPAAPLSQGRNAHHSNSAEQMHEALTHHDRYNWLEGDLRVDDADRLVMAHDAAEEGYGLTLDQWLAIGRVSERGLKVDVKETEAIPELLDRLEASGIPQGRLMINVGDLPQDQLREIRSRFPDAWLALNPSSPSGRYRDQDLDAIIADARMVGGRIAFPLRWDIASDSAIERLKPYGQISIWTSKTGGTPDDREREIDKLRERGVDGVIDLGPSSSIVERVWQSVNRGLTDVFGEDPVAGAERIARDELEDWRDPRMWPLLPLAPIIVPGTFAWGHGGDVVRGAAAVADGLADTAIDAAGDAAGSMRDLAAKAPVIGGLFD